MIKYENIIFLQNVNFPFFFPKPYFIVCLRLYDAIVTKQSSSHKTVIFRTTNHNIVHTTPTSTTMDRGDCDDIDNTRPMTITPKLRKKWGKLWSTAHQWFTIRYGTPYINRSHLRSTISLPSTLQLATSTAKKLVQWGGNWRTQRRWHSFDEVAVDHSGAYLIATESALILRAIPVAYTRFCIAYHRDWQKKGTS